MALQAAEIARKRVSFSGKQLADAKKFQVSSVVYTVNLDNASGQSGLIGG